MLNAFIILSFINGIILVGLGIYFLYLRNRSKTITLLAISLLCLMFGFSRLSAVVLLLGVKSLPFSHLLIRLVIECLVIIADGATLWAVIDVRRKVNGNKTTYS